MQVENDSNREVYNGDLGLVRRLGSKTCSAASPITQPVASPISCHGTGKPYPSITAAAGLNFSDPRLSSSCSRHNTDPLLQRNLNCTVVTRGRRLVVIVGQKKALAIAVKSRQTKRRWSKLKE